ncbi:MAG: anaerobic ribonucleoside-triphosphate reductase activating protein [Clostridia bacterium]|nr:anaerobic ribonucleoside-triphosphate reductase activating protein [Clostridia bacterium]
MLIGGFQKMTMLDYPGKLACTIFTYGCNFRCPFCHNASLVIDEAELIPESEIFSYLSKRKGMLDGVCITGGEPLLQKDIFEFMKKIKDMGFLVKLDTNGYLPEKLSEAISLGLCDYVAMDIKNSREKYPLTTGIEGLDISKICKSVEILLMGRVEYEFRTTVVKELHTKEDILKIGEWIRGAEKYFLQSFVDSGNLIQKDLSALDITSFKALLPLVAPYVKSCALRGV